METEKQCLMLIKYCFSYRFSIIGAGSPGKRRKARHERAETPTGGGGSFRIGAKHSRPTIPTSTSSLTLLPFFRFTSPHPSVPNCAKSLKYKSPSSHPSVLFFLLYFIQSLLSHLFHFSFSIYHFDRFSFFFLAHFDKDGRMWRGTFQNFAAVRSADNRGEKNSLTNRI